MAGLKKAPRAGRRAPVLMLFVTAAFAQNWPSFRGPGALGVVERASTPNFLGSRKRAQRCMESSMCRGFRIRVRLCGASGFI